MQGTYDGRHYGRSWFVWVVAALLIVVALGIVGVLFAHFYYPTTMPMYYGYPFFGWWFFPFGFIFFFLFIFLIARLIFWPLGGWGGRRRYWYRYGYGDSREILRRRYAMGEITKDQYDQMMTDLEQHQ